MDSSTDDVEDDPFCYKPLKRSKIAAPSLTKTKSQAPKKPPSKLKTNPSKSRQSQSSVAKTAPKYQLFNKSSPYYCDEPFPYRQIKKRCSGGYLDIL